MKDKTIITVVLTAAVTALIAVGMISFTNYQKEKFRSETEAKRAVAADSPQEPAITPAPALPTTDVAMVNPGPPPTTQPAVAQPLQPLTEPELFQTPATQPTGTQSSPQLQAEYSKMQAMRDREAAMMKELQNARAGGNAPTDPSESILSGLPGETTVSSSLVAAPAPKKLSRFEEEIKNEAAIASITHYDEQMNFLVMNGGQDRNIKPGQKFAVRSGVSIVGYVRVEEVTLNESIAKLVSANKDSVTARKPKLGDDLISYDRFAY